MPAGPFKADVLLAGSDTVVIGPSNLDLKEGTNTNVYAGGSAADKDPKLAVQTISGMSSAPGGVNAGGGGLAAAAAAASDTVRYVAIAGVAALAGGRALRRRKATNR